jgi:hypothetical protein
VTTVLFWTQTWSVYPSARSFWIVPSSCHGVVFAPGKGKCQEMLSLRMVVAGSEVALHLGQLHGPADVLQDGLGPGLDDGYTGFRGHQVRLR